MVEKLERTQKAYQALTVGIHVHQGLHKLQVKGLPDCAIQRLRSCMLHAGADG